MCAWGKANKVSGNDLVGRLSILDTSSHIYQLFLSDTKSFFSKNHAWLVPNTDRTARYAMIIEKDGTVSYIGNEPGPGVTVSSVRVIAND